MCGKLLSTHRQVVGLPAATILELHASTHRQMGRDLCTVCVCGSKDHKDERHGEQRLHQPA